MSMGPYQACVDHVRQLSGSEHTRAVAALLLQMAERYRDELESASGERVLVLQANLRQCRALLGVISGAEHADAVT